MDRRTFLTSALAAAMATVVPASAIKAETLLEAKNFDDIKWFYITNENKVVSELSEYVFSINKMTVSEAKERGLFVTDLVEFWNSLPVVEFENNADLIFNLQRLANKIAKETVRGRGNRIISGGGLPDFATDSLNFLISDKQIEIDERLPKNEHIMMYYGTNIFDRPMFNIEGTDFYLLHPNYQGYFKRFRVV